MDSIIGIGALVGVLVCLALAAYIVISGRQRGNLDSLLKASRGGGFETPGAARARMKDDVTGKEYERLKKIQKKKLKGSKRAAISKQERYFHAGLFSRRDIQSFERLKWILLLVATPLLMFLGSSTMGELGLLIGVGAGAIAAVVGPSFYLDSKIRRRGEEIMYYLPLVIEQVSIGVSSSLDIGPCLQRVVAMADERDTHNVVTELLRQAQYHIKSGISMEEALTEIGTRSGQVELKHTFMALASVAKHGGEISRQLQELADAVGAQRETKIEAKIKKLELEATGPVAMVFAGFLITLLTALGLQMTKAFVM